MKTILFVLSLLIPILSYTQNVNLEVFASGFASPTAIENAGDTRLFVLERDGIIKILNADGTINATPFFNISSSVSSGGERGLLGIAFHPEYVSNGYFYLNYTNSSGDTVVSRFSVTSDADIADVTSEFQILSVTQPYSNHNGGSIVFGPDGCLYIGMGDGGSGEDPHNYSQNPLIMLGKILRIDVDGGSPYAIPADNPFVGNIDYLDEIWAFGLRNPWKFSFDSANGDLWIADVGQYDIEEINKIAHTEAGINYGWRCYEGNSEFNTTACGNISDYTFPVAEYLHTSGRCSITGGYVYRGTQYTNFNNLYFFADYCTNEIGTVNPNNGFEVTFNGPFNGGFSAFGQDVSGELYVAGLLTGVIYKIIDQTAGIDENSINDDLIVKPNPASQFVNIESEKHQIIRYSIFNNLGELIKSDTFSSSNGNIDISTIQSGIYFINCQTVEGFIFIKKLLIK